MPHEKIREENKKKVIEEAARLFLENGLEMVTLEMIANAAGLTKRSVQNYFSSKDEIILEVFQLRRYISDKKLLFYAEMDVERAKEECKRMAEAMYDMFEKHAERLFGVRK